MNAHAQILKPQRQATAYVGLALKVIPRVTSADDLRAWWNDEQQQRDKYGLNSTQIQILIQASKEHVRSLRETCGARP